MWKLLDVTVACDLSAKEDTITSCLGGSMCLNSSQNTPITRSSRCLSSPLFSSHNFLFAERRLHIASQRPSSTNVRDINSLVSFLHFVSLYDNPMRASFDRTFVFTTSIRTRAGTKPEWKRVVIRFNKAYEASPFGVANARKEALTLKMACA